MLVFYVLGLMGNYNLEIDSSCQEYFDRVIKFRNSMCLPHCLQPKTNSQNSRKKNPSEN
jgi:hypothetical protein